MFRHGFDELYVKNPSFAQQKISLNNKNETQLNFEQQL